MYARPKANETQEDLEKLQEEFNKNKNSIKLAATVVAENKNDPITTIVEENVVSETINEQISNTFEAIPAIELGKIIQKTNGDNTAILNKYIHTNLGFPKPQKRNVTLNTSSGSIFAQQLKRQKVSVTNEEITPTTSKPQTESKPVVLNVEFEKEYKKVHQENEDIIKKMSEEEIRKANREIQETLDPAIINFLRSRKAKISKELNKPPKVDVSTKNNEDYPLEKLETTMEILDKKESERWLNFNVVEKNKLSWMKNMEIVKINKNKQFEARFDFKGFLLQYSENEITEKTRALYHHGEDSGRPGYTLQELFKLARSTVTQQQVIALNTIANILSLYSNGIYQDIIEIPVEQIFFILRICVDENTVTVLTASIKALRNIVYNEIDEVCLDSLLSFGLGKYQPILPVDQEDSDDSTVNDQQLAETNLIKCLLRTNILNRIRYIITQVKPSLDCIVCCLDILIRLARDSKFVLHKMYNFDGLISNIIKFFVPFNLNSEGLDFPYGTPVTQAIKLLRVLTSHSKNIAIELINKYHILNAISLYISDQSFSMNTNGLNLQSECFSFFSVFLHYKIGLDSLRDLQPILLRLLDYHVKNVDIIETQSLVKQKHCSRLIILLTESLNYDNSLITPFLDLFCYGLQKWTAQFSNLKGFSCGQLQAISSLILLSSKIRQLVVLPQFKSYIILANECIYKLCKSTGFCNVTNQIRSCSMLLNNYKAFTCNSNLKTLESCVWNASEHVIPIMQTNSCLLFLHALSEYVYLAQDERITLSFLQHENIQTYVNNLVESVQLYYINNWFARIECNVISNILKSSLIVQNNIDTKVMFNLAVKCLCVFNSEKKQDCEFILRNVIFNQKYYSPEILLQNLQLDQNSTDVSLYSLDNLDEILNVYSNVLGLKRGIPNFTSSLVVDVSSTSEIPVDWIYTPIVLLYSNNENKKLQACESELITIVSNCLRWIIIYEYHFPELASTINPTERYCRLCCVFLIHDSLFLNDTIRKLLEICIKKLVRQSEGELNFDKKLQGLANFEDFYKQLLEQYQGVSYGDQLFGNFIIIPLAQRHNVKWRKILWSEYYGVVETCNVTEKTLLTTSFNYLNPPEDDKSVLTCYRRALLNDKNKHLFLYMIANHHVQNFMQKMNNK